MRKKPAHRTFEESRKLVLRASAGLFVQKGYTATTLRQISTASDVNMGTLVHIYEHKDKILLDLVSHALEAQYSAAEKLLQGTAKDEILLWVAEAVLRLHIAESNEQMRELLLAAYSNPEIAVIAHQHAAAKHADAFRQFCPQYETKDFFELEIAAGSIIRGYMAIPCDMYFTMERKVRRFLETSCLIYRVPEERIQRIIQFVTEIDFSQAAQSVIGDIVNQLDIAEETDA